MPSRVVHQLASAHVAGMATLLAPGECLSPDRDQDFPRIIQRESYTTRAPRVNRGQQVGEEVDSFAARLSGTGNILLRLRGRIARSDDERERRAMKL